MGTITLPNFRATADVKMNTRLKDGGVYIEWSSLTDIKAWIYSDAQKAIAGRCVVSINPEDNTKLLCEYAASKPQYLGVNRLIVQAKYQGRTKTYDVPVFNFVSGTAAATGTVTIDDPTVDVEIVVEDVSSSILDTVILAAVASAERAEAAAEAAEHMVDIHTGPEGKSAYEVAVAEGYTGTEEEWLASLKGPVGETPDISIGSVTTVEPGTPASASMGGTPEAPVLNLSIPQGLVGATPNFTVGTVTTGEPGTPVVVNITGTTEAPVLNVTIPQGMQGNTGSSVDYPYELVNNLTTNDATKGLSAQQGKVLKDELSQLEAKVDDISTGKYYGYYATAADLPDDATVDGFAYVGSGPTYTIYNCDGGVWTSTGITVNQSPVGNDEDIDQNADGKLQFANRVYNSLQPDGMGYKILRKDATFASQVTDTNTIYEIRYDFDLNNTSVTIPAWCVLKFNGGTIKNGTISLNEGSQLLGDGASLSEIYIRILGENCEIRDINIAVTEEIAGGASIEYVILSQTNIVSGLKIVNANIVNLVGGCIKVITDDSADKTTDILIENCSLRFYLMGIELQNHTNGNYLIENARIVNNKFELSDSSSYLYGFAISLTGTGKHVSISQNTFGTVYYGVEIVGWSDISIDNNYFNGVLSDNGANPFSTQSRDAYRVRINGNTFEQGIAVGKLFDSEITNNVINSKDDRYSLTIGESDSVIISGNKVTSGFQYSMTMGQCTKCIVSNNVFTSTKASLGLSINGTNNLIIDNTISLIDGRKCFSISEPSNIVKNIKQVNGGIVWQDADTIGVYGGSDSEIMWALTWASTATLRLNIVGAVKASHYMTIPDKYTLNFIGGYIYSDSTIQITGGGNGPNIIGTVDVRDSVKLVGKWRGFGTFATVPTAGLYPGLVYFATDKGQAGVGAPIYYTGDANTPWVYSDGTAVS